MKILTNYIGSLYIYGRAYQNIGQDKRGLVMEKGPHSFRKGMFQSIDHFPESWSFSLSQGAEFK
jgi:hypothetical protein